MAAKYKNVRTVVGDKVFDSKAEAARYCELMILIRARYIRDLILQPKFPLIVNGVKICTYVADFSYYDMKGNLCVEDVKGFATAVFRLKSKLMLACHGINVVTVKMP